MKSFGKYVMCCVFAVMAVIVAAVDDPVPCPIEGDPIPECVCPEPED